MSRGPHLNGTPWEQTLVFLTHCYTLDLKQNLCVAGQRWRPALPSSGLCGAYSFFWILGDVSFGIFICKRRQGVVNFLVLHYGEVLGWNQLCSAWNCHPTYPPINPRNPQSQIWGVWFSAELPVGVQSLQMSAPTSKPTESDSARVGFRHLCF